MKKLTIIILSIPLIAASDAVVMPGMWESTMTFTDAEIIDGPEGLPGDLFDNLKGDPQIKNECVSPQEARQVYSSVLPKDPQRDCEIVRDGSGNGKIDLVLTCQTDKLHNEPFEMLIEGEYSSAAYNMDMRMNGLSGPKGSGMKMNMAVNITGRHVGDKCS